MYHLIRAKMIVSRIANLTILPCKAHPVPDAFCLLKGDRMAEYVNAEKAIETLSKLKAEREKRNCSRSQIIEAQAFGYAIAVIKKLPKVEINEEEGK